MKVRYLSHACFEISNSKKILIDPFFKGNSLAPKYEGKPDLVLITHEHYDHSDAASFDCKKICPPPCSFENAETMRIGDKKTIGSTEVEMVASSHHQSSYAAGYVIEFDGSRLYHAGDTYLDGVKPVGRIDVFFVPIGGTYTMNISEAVQALAIVKPKLAVPMHYNTFPQIKADPNEFKTKAEELGFKIRVMEIGEEAEID